MEKFWFDGRVTTGGVVSVAGSAGIVTVVVPVPPGLLHPSLNGVCGWFQPQFRSYVPASQCSGIGN